MATYEKAIQTAFREVADALAQRGTIDQQLAAQQSLTDAADVSMRIYSARYQQGSDTYQNFLIAERTYYHARPPDPGRDRAWPSRPISSPSTPRLAVDWTKPATTPKAQTDSAR